MYIRLIDTCLASYVLDHCNGPNELLIGIPVWRESCNVDVKNDLLCGIRDSEFEPEDKPGFDDDAAKAAVESYFAEADPAAPWPPSIHVEASNDDDDGEAPCSWFRLSWAAPEA